MELATGGSRNLRKSVACAKKNVCLFFFFLLPGMDRSREGWEDFLGSTCVWYCHSWWELLKGEAAAMCDFWKRGFILAGGSPKYRDPVKPCEQ